MTLKSSLFITVAAFALLSCGQSTDVQTETPTEQTEQSASEFKLEYEKFTLDNGLEVILHVDRSDPIVATTTIFHVGSNREKPGRTGFAHFFEHMAFNDSENVPRGWNRKAIPEWGGQRNGGTWSDGTIYYEVVPKDAFDKILWIGSDRLGYMIKTVTPAALEREKQVVKNEKRQRVDNAPYGYAGEILRKNLYPEGHPYSWTVIGSLPDLQAASLDDLTEFYVDYYGPNNATLSIVGDIDIEETKIKVQNWFGEIPRGKEVEPLPPMPVTLEADKKLYFEDNFAKLPALTIVMPSVEDYHEDAIPLLVLGQILSGSKNSPLHVQLVETDKLTPSVYAGNRASEIAGEFTFYVRAKDGVDLDDVYTSIGAGLDKFEAEGVNETELARIKAEQETILYNRMSTILGKGRELANANEYAGDPAYIETEARLIQEVTSEDVMRVYDKYVKDKPGVILSMVPSGQAELAIADSTLAEVWIEEVKADVASEEVSAGEVAEFEKTPTEFDRSEPPFGELPLIQMPDVWEAELPNNIPLLGIENDETPLVTFDITFAGGTWHETAESAGTFSLLADLMNEGTEGKTAGQIEQEIGLLGSGITVFSSAEETRISVTTLARNFEPTLDLVSEILFTPRFGHDEFDRVKSAALTGIKGREANPASVASSVFSKLIYTDAHPMGRPTSGTQDSVSGLSLEDMQSAHATMLGSPVTIHIAGDIDRARAEKGFAPVAEKLGASSVTIDKPEAPATDTAGRVFFIDVTGSKQSVLMIGKLTVARSDEDYNRVSFTNEKLGGGIDADLSQMLRIEKGYTYGAYSWISQSTVPAPFQARTSVRANATYDSLVILRDMISAHGPEFDESDAEIVQQKLIKESTRAFESLNAKLGTLRAISKYDLSKSYVESDQEDLLAMSVEDFQNTAAEYLDESEMVYLIVGDKATQFEPVQRFATESGKGEVIELDIYGERVGE